MNQKQSFDQKEIFYWKVTDLWKRFCEQHTQLLEKTSQEYTYLLESKIDDLDVCINEKNEILESINKLEKVRQDLISEFNKLHPGQRN